VCGPGVYNAATPLATAFTDSIPILLISGQIAARGRGLRSGSYHENDQLSACATWTKHRARVEQVASLKAEVDAAWFATMADRPGPALLEIPLDVQREHTELTSTSIPAPPSRPTRSSQEEIDALLRLIHGWHKPLIIAGGGVTSAGAEALLAQLADRLGAPVFHTFMGKCALSSEHPLNAGLPWSRATSDLTGMETMISPLFAEADGLLAIGCRFTQACTASWALKPPASVAQIDIDQAELGRHYPVTVGIQGDAAGVLRALLEVLPQQQRLPWSVARKQAEAWRLPGIDLVGPLRRLLPRPGIVVADITRLGYILLAEFPVYEPRTFLHPAGFVAMGYGIPAAIGAKTAFPERPVVAVVGDGCFQMCGSGFQLATAVQENIPIVVVLINDGSLTLIKAIQERRYGSRFFGVDLRNPDFPALARAMGVRAWQVDNDATFERALQEALACGEPALVEACLKLS
jgi:acetolactate synthase-1/2/3 large subunit